MSGEKITGFEKLAKIPKFSLSGAGAATFSARASSKITPGGAGGGKVADRLNILQGLRGSAAGAAVGLSGDAQAGNGQHGAIQADVGTLQGSTSNLTNVVGSLERLAGENAQWIIDCANELANAIARCNIEDQKEHKQQLQNKITAQGIIEGKWGEAGGALGTEEELLASSSTQLTDASSGVQTIRGAQGEAEGAVRGYEQEIAMLSTVKDEEGDPNALGGGVIGNDPNGQNTPAGKDTLRGNVINSANQQNRVTKASNGGGSVRAFSANAIRYAQGVIARAMV